jgi:drug/metabolite transporter (DMT)-like permease
VRAPPKTEHEASRKARLLLVLLSFAWGINWPAMRVALIEVSPWTLRLVGFSLGTFFLFAVIVLQWREWRIPFGRQWTHLFVSALLNSWVFGIFSSYAQIMANTSRVAFIAYSMPVWASLMAWLVLGERLNTSAKIGLLLCGSGLAVLIYPVLGTGAPQSLLLAIGCALSWAAGTVYVKWAQIRGDLVAITAWQLVICSVVTAIGLLWVLGIPSFAPVRLATVLGTAYSGIIGMAVAYLLWFHIVGQVSAATASLGSLSVPVIGTIGSLLMLGEWPSTLDIIGFVLIFAASASVILQPRALSRP